MSMPFASSMPVRPTVSKCSTAHPISGNGCFKNNQEPQAPRKTASHVQLAWPRDSRDGIYEFTSVFIYGPVDGNGRGCRKILGQGRGTHGCVRAPRQKRRGVVGRVQGP